MFTYSEFIEKLKKQKKHITLNGIEHISTGTTLTYTPHIEQIMLISRSCFQAGRNKVGHSYHLKHILEFSSYSNNQLEALGLPQYNNINSRYVANGEMILALVLLGYDYKLLPDSPNVMLNCRLIPALKKELRRIKYGGYY